MLPKVTSTVAEAVFSLSYPLAIPKALPVQKIEALFPGVPRRINIAGEKYWLMYFLKDEITRGCDGIIYKATVYKEKGADGINSNTPSYEVALKIQKRMGKASKVGEEFYNDRAQTNIALARLQGKEGILPSYAILHSEQDVVIETEGEIIEKAHTLHAQVMPLVGPMDMAKVMDAINENESIDEDEERAAIEESRPALASNALIKTCQYLASEQELNIGRDIRSRMARLQPVDFIHVLALDAVNAMIEAQKNGVMHRDISPGNFIYSETNRQFLATDFSRARVKGEEKNCLEKSNPIMGNCMHTAPEILQSYMKEKNNVSDPKFYTEKSEVYALGTMLYEIAAANAFEKNGVVHIPAHSEFADAILILHSQDGNAVAFDKDEHFQRYLTTVTAQQMHIAQIEKIGNRFSKKPLTTGLCEQTIPNKNLATLIAEMLDPNPKKRPELCILPERLNRIRDIGNEEAVRTVISLLNHYEKEFTKADKANDVASNEDDRESIGAVSIESINIVLPDQGSEHDADVESNGEENNSIPDLEAVSAGGLSPPAQRKAVLSLSAPQLAARDREASKSANDLSRADHKTDKQRRHSLAITNINLYTQLLGLKKDPRKRAGPEVSTGMLNEVRELAEEQRELNINE